MLINNRKLEIAIIVALVAGITTAHYLTPPDKPILHDAYRWLYYIPIAWAAVRFGLTGGLLTSIVISLIYIPHVWHRWSTIPSQNSEAVFAMVLYNAIAAVTGILANSEKYHRDRLEEANIALMRSNQMKLLGEIAAGMAHEIRNPLASLKGGIDILAKEETSPAERAEVAGIISTEVDRIERAIKDFLSYAKPADPFIEPLDLGEVASDVHQLLVKGGHDGITFPISVPDRLPRVMGDRAQMRSVILNLAINAISAVNGKGTVGVSVEREPNGVVLKVYDDGQGIRPEIASKIFEPFYTTREKGLGLGLSIVKRVVEEHGGTITMGSSPGKGATFALHFKGIKDGTENPDSRG